MRYYRKIRELISNAERFSRVRFVSQPMEFIIKQNRSPLARQIVRKFHVQRIAAAWFKANCSAQASAFYYSRCFSTISARELPTRRRKRGELIVKRTQKRSNRNKTRTKDTQPYRILETSIAHGDVEKSLCSRFVSFPFFFAFLSVIVSSVFLRYESCIARFFLDYRFLFP